LIGFDAPVLITGANGFIGTKVVDTLLQYGFQNLRCLVRGSGDLSRLKALATRHPGRICLIEGNLLSREQCKPATSGVSVVYHLSAGTEKTFSGCFMNSVVATRNLLDLLLENTDLKRLVNVSSLAVYSNAKASRGGIVDEKSEVDPRPNLRFEAYTYGKVKQDEIVMDYADRFRIPYVIVRPGDVFGPGKVKISGKIGIDTFGVYLLLGGDNPLPLTYVDNCAEAIVLAGLKAGIEGEIFNIVDDDPPTGREFLKRYGRAVDKIYYIPLPYRITYFLCYLWEKYSEWSQGQIPPAFNRRRCVAHWKKVSYSNAKIKARLGWRPIIGMEEALNRYFGYMREHR
jgi:nucleoside-diphosphate-sugar epimerase